MPRFTYIALDSHGRESTGLIEAASTNEAIGQLRRAGFFPTNIYDEGKANRADEKVTKHGVQSPQATQPSERSRRIVLFRRKTIKPKILMIFTRQLATLIDS